MPKLTVNNQTFAYPDPGSEPGWGEDATGWAEATTVALASISGSGTVYESRIAIPASQVLVAAIPNLAFSKNIVGSAEINYRIFRKTDSIQATETGMISVMYNSSTATWDLSQLITVGGSSLVTFSIDSSGQIFYIASILTGTYDAPSSYMRFKTISTLQA
jgi:hypothetical protein